MLPDVGSTMVPPGPQLPVALGRLDHPHADAVLHRAAGVQVLELGDHRRREAAGDPLQPDERRVRRRGRGRWGTPGPLPAHGTVVPPCQPLASHPVPRQRERWSSRMRLRDDAARVYLVMQSIVRLLLHPDRHRQSDLPGCHGRPDCVPAGAGRLRAGAGLRAVRGADRRVRRPGRPTAGDRRRHRPDRRRIHAGGPGARAGCDPGGQRAVRRRCDADQRRRAGMADRRGRRDGRRRAVPRPAPGSRTAPRWRRSRSPC